MPMRPTIFVSAVSKELRSARQLVANTLTFLGYDPIWQEIFGTEVGDLREMLRRRIDDCEGVVQLVGKCYGFEGPKPDPEFGRISYTQYEALYARKRGKKVWYFFIEEGFPVDPHDPEPEEQAQIQAAYRAVLKADTQLFHPLSTKEALETGVLKLRDDLTKLRRGAKRWAVLVVSLLVLIGAGVAFLMRGQGKTMKAIFGVTTEVVKQGEETRKAVSDVSAQVAREADTLEQIAKRFDSLSSNGGLVAGAKTPEEHYHNARVHELGGNVTAARQEYAEYLASNLEALDPWMSYLEMLKSAEGHAGAVAAMQEFGRKLQPPTVSFQTTMALLEDGPAREAKLEALAAEHPDFGPLPWLVSQEFSEAKRGDQTLSDKRAEKAWLEKFRAAEAAGKFERYFIDKKEARKWIESADRRWAKLGGTPDRVLQNPVTISAMESNSGWSLNFLLSDFKAKELFYRLDGKGDFQSTGHQTFLNPQTGLPMVNLDVPVPNPSPGAHSVEVKYLDKNDQMNGPYQLNLDTDAERLKEAKTDLNMTIGSWLAFKDYEGRTLLFFSQLMSYRPVLKEIRYSLDSDSLDKRFHFKPTDQMFGVGDDILLYVPQNTKFASVQVVYKDGTTSPVQKFFHKRSK